MISFHFISFYLTFYFISFYLTFYFLRCILHCKKYKLKTYYLTLQSSVHQATPPQEIMTPVTRQSASIHIASHTSRYDYLNAAKKNIATDDNKQQQDYDKECFDGGDDARISTSTRTTRNSKLKHQQQQQEQQQQQIITKKSKTVAFANQNQKQEQEPAQEQQQLTEQKPKGKTLSKRQAKKYDAQIEAVEAASILASIAAAAASASKKERTPPYWTRQHEKAKAGARLQKAMSSVLQSDYEIEFV